MDYYKHILTQQFHLAYFGRVDLTSTEEMAIQEREILYSLLVQQKQDEKKAHEEALQQARSKKSGSWRRH